MGVLVPAFLAAAIGEWGDKTQLLVALLGARSGRLRTVFVGLLVAAAVSSAVAAYAGSLVAATIDPRARSLLLGLALLIAGVSGLFARREPGLGSPRVPLLLATIILCLAAEIGDRTQFVTFGLAGQFQSPGLTAAGATAGIIFTAMPALLLGRALPTRVPLRALRWITSALFLGAGFVVAIHALRVA
jgi:putative Ca2+/H+ antiporter (TMEM165/GDT1 family)